MPGRVMSYFVMSCHVMSHHVISYRAVLCWIVLCCVGRVVSCRATLCCVCVVLCCAKPCYPMLLYAMLCYVMLWFVFLLQMLHSAVWCHVMLHPDWKLRNGIYHEFTEMCNVILVINTGALDRHRKRHYLKNSTWCSANEYIHNIYGIDIERNRCFAINRVCFGNGLSGNGAHTLSS